VSISRITVRRLSEGNDRVTKSAQSVAASQLSNGVTMMRMMVIVRATKESEAGVPPDETLIEAMSKFNNELKNAGVFVEAGGLRSSARGARVRFAGDTQTVIDGPFAESKELIAGFWIWNVNSLEEAIAWVKRCPNPSGKNGEIEIRPMFEGDDCGDPANR
jgi:hypothetical protein